MKRVIAILDDNERRLEAMGLVLTMHYPQYEHKFFDNAPDMIDWCKEHLRAVMMISLDHDLGVQ